VDDIKLSLMELGMRMEDRYNWFRNGFNHWLVVHDLFQDPI